MKSLKDVSGKTVAICILILVAGFASSIGVFISLQEFNDSRKESTLNSAFESVTSNLEREIEKNLNALYALKANYIAHEGMSRKEFTIYANYYTSEIKSIQALEWVPAIKLADRDSFELASQNEGYLEYHIFTRVDGKLLPAEEREIYYPVHFIEPFAGNEAALGFDPGPSLPTRQQTIDKAISIGKAAVSNVATIIQKKGEHKAIFVFVPVYSSDMQYESNEVVGLYEGVYLIRQLIDEAVSSTNLTEDFELRVRDGRDSTQLLFGDTQQYPNRYSKHRQIEVADNYWDVELSYKGEMVFSAIDPFFALFASIMFTLLIVKTVFDNLTDNRKQLRLHVKELQRKNSDLEQYAYVASHDLQEPLHTIVGLSTMLRSEYRDKIDEVGKQFLDHLQESSERMSALITNLLNYSKIGNVEEPVEVNCNHVLKQVKQDLNFLLNKTNAKIVVEGSLPVLIGYPYALHLLFQNLISNALKFQKTDSKPLINISAKKGQSGWQFSVKDNGIGIAQDNQAKIFEIFKRLHNRTIYEGTGIGLANCKKIVELHDGDIWVESALGKGSTFYFTINLD